MQQGIMSRIFNSSSSIAQLYQSHAGDNVSLIRTLAKSSIIYGLKLIGYKVGNNQSKYPLPKKKLNLHLILVLMTITKHLIP